MDSKLPHQQSPLSATGKAIQDACRVAVRDALIEHKLRGFPVATADNGIVKWIPADQIVIPPEEPK